MRGVARKKRKSKAQEQREAAAQRKAERARLKQDWLSEYAEQGWRGACAAVGCAMSLPTYWRLHDEEFASQLQRSQAYYGDRLAAKLEAVAIGDEDLTSTQASLMRFRMQALRPEEYRERVSVEQSGPGGGPIKVESGDAGRGMELLERWRATD